jgi:biopolymer transport protein TolQ
MTRALDVNEVTLSFGNISAPFCSIPMSFTMKRMPLLEVNFWELVKTTEPVSVAVRGILVVISLLSWTLILAKFQTFRSAQRLNREFLKTFRKTPRLDTVAAMVNEYRPSPLAGVFDFGFSEVSRQFAARRAIVNPQALERTLQLGVSEEVSRLEKNMNWLATFASVSPFIGLLGTVWGIIQAFSALGLTGSTSMRTVAPGIADALVATALGLFAAIPAAVFYNYFGHAIKEIGSRMEDFSLEFLNMTERNFGE